MDGDDDDDDDDDPRRHLLKKYCSDICAKLGSTKKGVIDSH